MKKDKSYYAWLRNMLTLVIILLATLPMLLVGWTSSNYYQKYDEENTSNGLRRLVANRREIISLFLNNHREILEQLMRLHNFDFLSQQENLDRVFAAISKSGVIVDLGVIDSSGRHIAYVGPYKSKLASRNYANTDWFQEVMINGTFISDVYLGYRGVPHFVVAVSDPLKRWILRATINSEIFNAFLRTAQVDPKGDAFIINKKGELQTPSLLNESESQIKDKNIALSYHEGTLVRTANDTVYVSTWLKDGDWLLVVKVRRQKALETFLEAKSINEIIVLCASIVIIAIAVLMVRFIVNNIEATARERAVLDSQMVQMEKMASLGRLAAGVAHEVNNPLQMITDQAGWIGELLDEEETEKVRHIEEYQQSIQKIRQHVKRASSVTHRLLGFSRKMQSEKTAVDINFLIRETISFLENEAGNNQIAIETQLEAALPAIMTDAGQVGQVLFNLLNNAMDAVGKNGTIHVGSRQRSDAVVVEVADSGPGIRPELINKIFEPFFTTKAPDKGTGLGLAISYNIIQKLGGTIKAWNREEGGAIFTVILPKNNLGD